MINTSKNMKKILLLLTIISLSIPTYAIRVMNPLQVGASQLEVYQPMLLNKRVALVVNQTSMIGNDHLVDVLKENGINIVKIFGPEHGFRGKADAGEKVKSDIDEATNVAVVSLYGSHKKPTVEDLANVDIVLFDIQDVGARFYTYISTLQYVMEACAENKKKCIVLDRPNPNGHYVDGPVLNAKNKSFVGMQAIPIVHGMTIGEYAKMLNGEGWLAKKIKCDLEVIKVIGYNHKTKYNLPIAPSPNLKTMSSIYLYPSLCLFEGTEVSVGRGTDNPFEMWGHPTYEGKEYSFTPKPNVGSKDPPFNGKVCLGENLIQPAPKVYNMIDNKLHLEWLIEAYQMSVDKKKFFIPFFTNLAGNTILQKQIASGMSEEKIRATWKADIDKFKKIRKKYLLYKDFE
jgi:uncharacterized protein YbbC (DUF1343 family)